MEGAWLPKRIVNAFKNWKRKSDAGANTIASANLPRICPIASGLKCVMPYIGLSTTPKPRIHIGEKSVPHRPTARSQTNPTFGRSLRPFYVSRSCSARRAAILCCPGFLGFFTHDCMTNPGVEVLFQSQTEEKAAELVDYAKCLYDRQDDDIKALYPLAQPLAKQSNLELNFRDGNRIVGIPHGADKIRSYHPTGLLIDEAAFIPDAGQSFDEAIAACQKIAVLSSANTALRCGRAASLPWSARRLQ